MDEPKPTTPGRVDINKIYPEAAVNAVQPSATPQGSRAANQARMDSDLDMAGVRKLPPSNKTVDIIGWLMVAEGLVSIASTYRSFISLIFSILYIILGLLLLQRISIARKIIVYMTAFGILMSIVSLIGLSIFISSPHTLKTIASTLFSLVVDFVVISVLTQSKVIAEFR